MLIPAVLRKEEILEAFKRIYYTEDMILETASLCTWLPEIEDEPNESLFQYAIVDKADKLVGFICYRIDWYSSSASQFGLISFDKGNPAVAMGVRTVLKQLIDEYKLHRIEWRMVGNNPAKKHYDRFCKRFGGRKIVLRDTFKDRQGNYRDDIIYEIIRNKDEVK